VSESPENSTSAQRDGPAHEPAALKPDEPTAVHPLDAPAEPTSPTPASDATPPAPEPAPSATEPGPPAPAWTPPAADASSASSPSGGSAVAERPEIAVGAAFAGGLVLALILKRLAR
jgi:hypothetical protein